MQKCLLCGDSDEVLDIYRNLKSQIFWKCLRCGFIFLSPEHHLPEEAEQARYRFHQNNVLDPDYQRFLRPVVDLVRAGHGPLEQGLDFGCGPASVISYLLKQESFQIADYDPLFFPDGKTLERHYDYITCTEVVEHLREPRKSFELLFKLLRPRKSKLYIKTSLTDPVQDFSRWYYHRDPTHVGFYCQRSFEFLKETLGFTDFKILNEVVILSR